MRTKRQSPSEQTKIMKTLKPLTLLFTTALLWAGTPNMPAQEETGRIIEKLVVEVDKKLASLEDLTDKHAEEKQDWKTQLEEQYTLYDKATNINERAAVRGEIVGLIARLNKADREEVGATLDTVVNICETMKKLQAAVKNSPATDPEKMEARKTQMSKFVQNSARIIKAVEKIDEGKPGGYRTAALKNSLTMLHRQMGDSLTGMGSAMTRINNTMRSLEDVAVQLRILQGVLENEHTMLLTATHAQTVDLALLRLGQARLGADSVADIPLARNNDVVERVRKSWRPISESDATLTGGSSALTTDEEFELIADDGLE